MVEKYNVIKRVASFDVDMSVKLKPTSFLNFAQEAANVHADYIGVGYDSMHVTRQAWVLSKIHVIFHRLPKWKDNVNMQSWHKGSAGLQCFRDFVMYDEKGEEKLISATTSWLVMDIDTRRLCKYSGLADEKAIKEDVIETPAPKLIMPKDVEPELVMTHPVNYSDLDLLGHVNNVKYTEWSMNVVELEVANNRPLKDLVVNFNNEIKPGDTVSLYRVCEQKENGDLVYLIEGRVEEKSSFIARLTF